MYEKADPQKKVKWLDCRGDETIGTLKGVHYEEIRDQKTQQVRRGPLMSASVFRSSDGRELLAKYSDLKPATDEEEAEYIEKWNESQKSWEESFASLWIGGGKVVYTQ